MAKVVHIIHEGSGGGGMTFALSYFPRYLPHFDTVAITGCAGELPDRLRALGVRTHALPLDRPLRCVLSIPRLAAVLRREKPDLVIIHGQWGGFCGAVGAWLAGVRRLIYYTQMPCFYTDWDFFRLVRNRIAEQVTCALATRIVCLSQAGRYQYLLRHLAPETRVGYIPNAVDTTTLRPVTDKAALRRELGLPVDAPLAVYVGRLEDQKRVDWLVRAWRRVEEKLPHAELRIVGYGSERGALASLADALGLKRCQFLGRQPEGSRYFQAADAGVITSLFEGQPLALLEAMACGCPMVGTAADGIAETILDGETGFCVPVADPAALAEKLITLLSDSKRAEAMGHRARERAATLYDLESVIARQIGLCREVLQGN